MLTSPHEPHESHDLVLSNQKSNDPVELFNNVSIFRTSLKHVRNTLEREVKLLQQLNFEEVSESISQLKHTTTDGSYIQNVLSDFEISFQTLDSIIKSVVEKTLRECIDPLKNFINYDFKDIISLKKQYDARLANIIGKTPRKMEKQSTITNILQEKVKELELKQETKMLDYFARFWTNWEMIHSFQNDQLQQLIQNIIDRNKKTKGFVNAIKEGHVLVKKKFGWVSNYFILKDGKLVRYISNGNFVIYDLLLCSLKSNYHSSSFDAEDSSDKHKSRFVIVSAKSKKMKSIVMQTESPEEKEDWVHKISQQIQTALCRNTLSSSDNTLEKQFKITSCSTNTNESSKIHELLLSIPGNDKCCDCFADNPDWAIINMGTLVCQDCSGIHRNFGVQVSKVRSLVLDVKIWTPELIQMFINLGNKHVNALLLSNASVEDYSKFRTISSPVERDALLKMKYLSFKFTTLIDTPKTTVQTDTSCEPQCEHSMAFSFTYMNEFVSENKEVIIKDSLSKNVIFLQKILKKDYNMKDACELIFNGDISKLLLLIMNDFNVCNKDKHGWTLLHYAAWYNKPHICSLLLHNKFKKDTKDSSDLTPVIVAEINHSNDAVKVLNGVEPTPFTIIDINSIIQEDNTFETIQSTIFPPQYPILRFDFTTKQINNAVFVNYLPLIFFQTQMKKLIIKYQKKTLILKVLLILIIVLKRKSLCYILLLRSDCSKFLLLN